MLRLLLPIDDAGKRDHAVRYAAMCQRESRAPIRLDLLHVEAPFSSYVASKLPAGTIRRYHDDHSRAVLEPVAAAFDRAHIPRRTHTVVGDPVTCIVDHARDTGIDRIALVTHARQTIPEVLFGSVTSGVLQQSPVPVEVVPIEPGVVAARLRARRRRRCDDSHAGVSRARITEQGAGECPSTVPSSGSGSARSSASTSCCPATTRW